MKKRLLFSFGLCFFLHVAFSQVSLDWLKTINSPSESGGSIAVDQSNNSYAAAVSGNSTYLTKRNASGGILWSSHSSSSFLEGIVKVFVDPTGNPVVAGFQYYFTINGIVAKGLIVRKFTSGGDSVYRTIVGGLFTYLDGGDIEHPGNNQTRITAVMDPTGNIYFGTAGDAGTGKGFLAVKISSSGKLLYIRSQNFKQDTTGNPFFYASRIALKNNQLALTGTTKHISANISTWLLDTSGKSLGTNISNGIGGVDVVFDNAANVYVLGNGLNAVNNNYTANDIVLIKLNKQGVIFYKAFDFSGAELGQKLVFTADNRLIALSSLDSLNDKPLAPAYLLVTKFDLNGSLLWKRVPINGTPKSLISDAGGNVYVIGSGGPPTGDFLYGSYGLTLKYAANGSEQWRSLLHLYNFTPIDIDLGVDTSVFVISSPAATVAHFIQKGKTLTCTTPSGLKTVSTSNNTATVLWKKVPDVFLYYLQYKTVTATEWTQVVADSNRYTIKNLQQGTNYDFRVQAICASEPSDISSSASFKTTGLGYCASKGPDNNCQWIDGVHLGAINTYPSGPDDGYKDFTSLSTNIQVGSTYTITTNKYNLCGSIEAWRIWIDYNHDGDFEDSDELIVQYSNNYNYDYHDFTVPSNALPGTTRMRVSMKAGSAYSTPCEMLADGEVEDYSVDIVSAKLSTADLSNALSGNGNLRVSPNPAKDVLHVSVKDLTGVLIYEVFDASGNKVVSTSGNNSIKDLDIQKLSSGIYLLRVSDKNRNTRSVKFLKIP